MFKQLIKSSKKQAEISDMLIQNEEAIQTS